MRLCSRKHRKGRTGEPARDLGRIPEEGRWQPDLQGNSEKVTPHSFPTHREETSLAGDTNPQAFPHFASQGSTPYPAAPEATSAAESKPQLARGGMGHKNSKKGLKVHWGNTDVSLLGWAR